MIDQIVGAVCRLILANRSLVPLDDVLPVIFKNLPLKEDEEEYEIVFKCCLTLLDVPIVKENADKIVALAVNIHMSKRSNEKIDESAVHLIKQFYGQLGQSVVQSQSPEVQEKIAKIVST